MAEEGDGKEANVELPGGIKIQTKGYHLGNVLQFIIAAGVAAGVYTLIDMRADAKQAVIQTAEHVKASTITMKMEHDKLGASIDRGTEQQEIMNYILTLSPERREKLNLQMPESLRRRVIGRDP